MSRLPVRFRSAAVLVFVLVFAAAAAVRFGPSNAAFVTANDAGGDVERRVEPNFDRTDDGVRPPFFVPEQYFLTNPSDVTRNFVRGYSDHEWFYSLRHQPHHSRR